MTDLRNAILKCVRCDLSSRAGVKPVPWQGPTPAAVAVVGEAPGLQENVQGRPFVSAGASGRLLRNTLAQHGANLDDWCVMNTVSCFPDATPTVEQQRACRIHLKRQLRAANPRFVLVLGAVALNYFDPGHYITLAHGRWNTRVGYEWFPTFHPAAALRNPERRLQFEADIRKFCADLRAAHIL